MKNILTRCEKTIVLIFILILEIFCNACSIEKQKQSIDSKIMKTENYNNILILFDNQEFQNAGFNYGDSVNLSFLNGYTIENVPYLSKNYAPIGELALVPYNNTFLSLVPIKGENLWEQNSLSKGDKIKIELQEKERYIDIQQIVTAKYSDNKNDFSTNEEFANFRNVNVGNIVDGRLYRGASPVDNSHKRAETADDLCQEKGIRTILDLSDTEKSILKNLSKNDFESAYFKKLYENGDVIPCNMEPMYCTEKTQKVVVESLKELCTHEPPYYIHCVEGKDRTGFVLILIEMLCGANYEEIENDFMKTQYNYFHFDKETNPERYNLTKEIIFKPMIGIFLENESINAENAELEKCAEEFLEKYGMTKEEIEKLKNNLTNGLIPVSE